MLDVAQNTARLNTLIAQYYTVETQLEDKTESKLTLTRSISQQTIENNKNSLSMTNRYNALEDQLAKTTVNVDIDGVTVPDMTTPYGENWFKTEWETVHPEPKLQEAGGTGNYVKVNEQSEGYRVEDLINDTVVQQVATAQVNNTKPDDPGAEPQQGGFTKQVTENGETKTVPDEEAYNKAHAEWQAKKDKLDEWTKNFAENVKEKAIAYVQSGYQNDKITDKNRSITESFNQAHTEWENDRKGAISAYNAGFAQATGNEKALQRAKEKERQENEIAYQEQQADLSAQEAALDQEIQMLQAEVTAIKTEIDSLKQERNSNVQSDFKMFG